MNKKSSKTNKRKLYDRVEVIGAVGREYVFYGLVEAVEQDNGKTLKVVKR